MLAVKPVAPQVILQASEVGPVTGALPKWRKALKHVLAHDALAVLLDHHRRRPIGMTSRVSLRPRASPLRSPGRSMCSAGSAGELPKARGCKGCTWCWRATVENFTQVPQVDHRLLPIARRQPGRLALGWASVSR
jgi:hypothetical protein